MLHSRIRFTTAACLLMVIAGFTNAYAVAPHPGFPVTLNGDRIISGSVTLADLNNDRKPEILVGEVDGILHAVSSAGVPLWTYDVSAAINRVAPKKATQRTPIRTAPAVTDMNGDG